ncbi:NAD(P)-dependent oxidoreductase [Pseudomonas carnis]|uniref:NAD(P)-dependent oxidoreductase n=1 Tax=Pseudomonas synxantha TaxID=47883 RepID=A0A5D3GI16_9PSED|nr:MULTISPECIES: NAD(P)-dependent oxidoreductase [Pseudomonas]MBA6044163.1 pyridine nucleotide transhydrogenase [Pseudomonas lactis]MBB4814694.1 dTDP-4-dehydrorhamnose reductase [Pseudomonas rhodesiae]MBH3366620.1 NAD(P)-dependent oxidoreductase [Pseudomonas carnis]TYK60289.1 NAD(P)-dependent oxidoreductase [Pseudomonas synxantha]
MFNSLIGYSGYVGGTLLKQENFTSLYRSTNIGDIDNQTFDTVVCAGAPAQKWIANREPEADLQKIEGLIAHLKTIQCKTFILISTVDVFKNPIGVDEDTPVDESGLHAYGLHRRLLETFVEEHFPKYLIVRLPGLVGPSLRKNVIFDFLNDNNLQAIDSRGVFQFYPMVNLWYDIQTALKADLKLVHLTAEPVSVADISQQGFGKHFTHTLVSPAAAYDLQTKHAHVFGASGGYQYSARETMLAVRAYAQSEPLTIKTNAGLSA